MAVLAPDPSHPSSLLAALATLGVLVVALAAISTVCAFNRRRYVALDCRTAGATPSSHAAMHVFPQPSSSSWVHTSSLDDVKDTATCKLDLDEKSRKPATATWTVSPFALPGSHAELHARLVQSQDDDLRLVHVLQQQGTWTSYFGVLLHPPTSGNHTCVCVCSLLQRKSITAEASCTRM
jgi:hypothetical protein